MSARPQPILLVEDDPNDVAVALRALRRSGFEAVDVARDGEEALDYLRSAAGDHEDCPVVVFLDLKMPRLDGWEVLREIRADRRMATLPVVVVSASRRPDDVRRSYELGANSFLVKQFDARRPGGYLVDAARYWIELNEAPPDGGKETP